MNERLPYEEMLSNQLGDLPIPDENLAWADMKRRLDEDDDHTPIAWWRRGCMLWGLLLVAALTAGWFLFKPGNWFRKEKQTVTKTELPDKNAKNKASDYTINNPVPDSIKDDDNNKTSNGTLTRPANSGNAGTGNPAEKNATSTGNNIINGANITAKQPADSKDLVKLSGGGGKKKVKAKQTNDKNTAHVPDKNMPKNNDVPPGSTDTAAVVINQPVIQKDTFTGNKDIVPKKDIPHLMVNDTSKPKNNNQDLAKKSGDTTQKKDDKKVKDKTPFIFSAGIAVHQQLPVGGQQLTPYNSLGRKGSLADYIPSVYLRFEKENKWFLQSEFRYGAPQYAKEFAYRQSVVPDTGSNPAFSTITTSTLKKTFYHQLPLTFNYFIKPGWSVGAGLQWNKFVSAVSEKQVSRKNNFTQQESVVSKLITKEDTAGSIFKKSYWQAVFETQYKWKRFSFGARYAFGLEPYIQFRLPGQAIKQERNQTVQLFIRYELWRQKKSNGNK